jgi:membrane fusion protein, protease secretion system
MKINLPDLATTDTLSVGHAARIGYRIIAIGLGGFILWATLAPLDEGVPTPGTVAIDTKRKAVQHLQGGIVKEVLVREGQLVKEGEIVLRLDESTSLALYEAAKQNLSGLRENVVAQNAMLDGLKRAEKNRRDQIGLIDKEVSGVSDLVKEGFAPTVQLLQLERTQADIRTNLSDIQANRLRTYQSILELQHQITAAQERLTSAELDLARLSLRAPATGQVVGLTVQSFGAVIQPAQKVMDIVPESESLIIETRIAPHFIDRLHAGDAADVRFTGFANIPQLVVGGQLISLSKDVLIEANQAPYYLARVAITPAGLAKLGSHNLQAGMQAEVILKTGERTLMQYLLHPLTKRMAASLKEH